MSWHPSSGVQGAASSDPASTGGRSADRGSGGAPTATKREALELFRGLPRRYDALSAALSLGQDPRWRRALVGALAPPPGARVLDVATGTGMVAAELLARVQCTVVGLDQSAEMLAAARARFAGEESVGERSASGAGPPIEDRPAAHRSEIGQRVELIEGEAEALPFADASFDALTFTYLLRYVDDPPATIRELVRVVRPGGRIASLEFGIPPLLPARAAWLLYTSIGLPALGRLASREWAEVGRFLGPSIRGFYERHPPPRIVDYWRQAGLQDVRVRRMSLGGGVLMSATKAAASAAAAGPAGAGEAVRGAGATGPAGVDEA